MVSKTTGIQGKGTQVKTLTLLALWDLGGAKTEVKKSDLTKRVTRTKEKAKDYQVVFEELQQTGAIAIATKNRVAKISLTDKGLQILGDGLKSQDFEFAGQQIGTPVANALVKWIRQIDTVGISQANCEKTSNQSAKDAIASYDEFKSVVLEVYDKLNYEYNFNHLVPIYRIRRAVGDRLSRTQFNDWLLEMQADDILQLQGGTVEDNAPDKIEDSITTVLDGLRCYAKLLKV
ncbi:unknown protein [Nostoc sp. NIES-3756]|uniref:hypothetical protein n=1 Tax=Nostoc sp. NIES-3756 TaxID=1751286 RepID=UPI000721FA82|nr:hypothetical protein [Nostoc sp. NIES-3756]BAT51747.1 unknown protein [Nostoc sp. NIES-3756]